MEEKKIKKSKMYTKTGDKGMTSLVGGQRVSKGSLRLDTYGTVDELNSFVGLLRATLPAQLAQEETLATIQDRLFTAGSYLATDNSQPMDFEMPSGITKEDIKDLEKQIDIMDSKLPELEEFIIPAGGKATSLAHVCRTITRRAERNIYKLLDADERADVEKEVKLYLNRLSDYFFVLARATARVEGGSEVYWRRHK